MIVKKLSKDEKEQAFVILAVLFGGILGGMFISYNPSVKITSLDDREIVHSIVIIDAIFDKGDGVGVWINDTFMADWLPFEWNNMMYPAGEYEIKVGIEKNSIWTYDYSTVIIPETFNVPSDYAFTEDFVVHEGQTVTIEDFDAFIADGNLVNGYTSPDNLNYYDVNVYGDLILINSDLKCSIFECSGDGSVTLMNGSTIFQYEAVPEIQSNGEYAGSFPNPRFGDNAMLYYDDTIDIDILSQKMVEIKGCYIRFIESAGYDQL